MTASIFDLPPIEQGGRSNRKGIHFQDHVGAGMCLDMVSNPKFDQVWFETHDDLTLIWKLDDGHEIEFVQVKSDEMDQLWSPARLCARENDKAGTSILERSLANDRASEPCKFRMATTRGIHSDLKLLGLRLLGSTRDPKSAEFRVLTADLKKRVGDYKSPNGHDCEFWAENVEWDELHSSDSAKNSAKLKLRKYLEDEGVFLTTDQVDELYSLLIIKVQDAAAAKYSENPKAKRLIRTQFIEWLKETIANTLHPASTGSGKQMARKMRMAKLPTDVIETAQVERRLFRQELLKPKYLEISDLNLLEGEVIAKLNTLKSQMDSGEINKTGPEFHRTCLAEIESLTILNAIRNIPSHLVQGAMYSVVDRCLHRFSRKS